MSDIKYTLRQYNFPHCAREALPIIGKFVFGILCKLLSTRLLYSFNSKANKILLLKLQNS